MQAEKRLTHTNAEQIQQYITVIRNVTTEYLYWKYILTNIIEKKNTENEPGSDTNNYQWST